PLELVDRDGARALDVPGGVLLGWTDVYQHDVPGREPLDELGAPDRLDLVAEVLACGALHLGQARRGDLAQGQPDPQGLVAGERIAHARAFAFARHEAGGMQ